MALPTPISQENLQVRMTDGTFKTVCPIPVGGIYLSTKATSPSNIFGGGWTSITGAVLRANNQAGVYSDSDTAKLTVSQLPAHSHYSPTGYFVCITNNGQMRAISPRIQTGSTGDNGWGGHVAEDARQNALQTGETGSGSAYNTKQRAYNIYAWKRTS